MNNQITAWQCFTKTKELTIDLRDDYIEVNLYSLGKPNLAGLQERSHVETLLVEKTDETLSKLFSYESLTHALKLAKANQIQLQTVTPCPVPAPTPAKSVDKGQGILFSNQDVIGDKQAQTDDDIPPCFMQPVNGMAIPKNLE